MSDASRNLYLVCYDVCSPKRLRRVYKFLLGYRVGGQKSFFECWLTPADLRQVRERLAGLIEAAEDRVHIFQLDPRMACERLGVAQPPATGPVMVV
ncbi:MAG: CRISPR-associated endonuclease Cas2 [Rhodocyclaceae bacterium]|nr:CRISPR-associated endoribonuclease Cas2 [Bacteroidia bacterium]MCQ3925098.1 CRISPR-associated endonuclease Cas2 [Rhodocyclaceae bacterium]